MLIYVQIIKRMSIWLPREPLSQLTPLTWLPLPYIGIAKYSDKCDSVITAEIKLENC